MIDINSFPMVINSDMNDIHIQEAIVLNGLISLIHKNGSFETVMDRLGQLNLHIQSHFDAEEKKMQEIHYPMYRLHKGEHDKILNQVRFTEMEFRNRKDAYYLKYYLENDFASWLTQHIKAMDVVLANAIQSYV